MTALRTCLIIILSICFGLSAPVNAAEEAVRGQVVGGIAHPLPDWFKESFLEIADDVDEATEEGRHVMLFFDLNGCPYCARMLDESFRAEPNSSYIQENFDVIAVNIQGDRDIAFNDEISVTEKELADILQVFSTPALVFLDENNQTIVRVNGYRAPERFGQVLEFVATRSYRSTGLASYMEARLQRNVYQLRDNPRFSDTRDLSAVEGPLMLIFEDGGCYDCNEFHDGILADPRVSAELAARFEMIYRPGVILLEDGNLLRRHDSLTFPHHFSESLRYVGRGIHRETDYRSYVEKYREDLLAAGVDIDLGRSEQ